MFERFTDKARKVMAIANEQVQLFNHQYIGTEHIFLGLVKEGGGTAAAVISRFRTSYCLSISRWSYLTLQHRHQPDYKHRYQHRQYKFKHSGIKCLHNANLLFYNLL